MKYHNITKDDMLNGDGLRVVLWVSGCEHHCDGCQNPVTWDPNDGIEFDGNAVMEICHELKKDYVSGLTISGGDPLYPANRETVLDICRHVKELFPGKTIWLYTGYTFWEVPREILPYVDVIVDGKYVKDLANVHYKWAGSTNQVVWKKSVNGEWVPTREYETEINEMEGCPNGKNQ